MAATLRDSHLPIRFALALLLIGPACGRPSLDSSFAAARDAVRRGALDEALSHVNQAAAAAGSDLGDPAVHQLRLLRAEVLLTKADLPGAAALVDVPIPEGPAFAAARSRQRYVRARLEITRGLVKQALTTLESIGELDREADLRLDADILAGQALLRLGRLEEGEARLKQTLEEAERRGDRYRQMLAMNNLGMRFVNQRRFDEALPWFTRALAFTDLTETSVFSASLTNAGLCHARLGNFERALEVQQRAVVVLERGGAALYEQALGELGSTYALMEDVARGVPYLTKALAVAQKAGLNSDAALWARNLAAAYVHTNQWDQAEQLNEQAKRLTPANSGRTLFTSLHAADIAAGRQQNAEAARLYREILAEPAAEAALRWAAHDGLALVAQRAGDSRMVAAELDEALKILESTRSTLTRADDRLSFSARLTRFYRTYVDFLIERGDVERALMVAENSRAHVLAERHGVSVPAVATPATLKQLAAASRTVLLSYWLGPTRSFAWTVDGKGVRLHTLPAAAAIESLVRQHQEAIHGALGDPLAPDGAGEKLRQLLVEPVLGSVRPGSAIVIVPDGALHGLNFETLPASGTPRFLIEDVEAQVAPSLALLGQRRGALPARSLLVVGNPTPRNPDFPALRYASAEMSNIVRHFGGESSRTYEGEQASPREFRSARPEQFSFVHFTAHATANRESPLDSAVILSGPDDGYKLYARDVADLPLRAELVTVSACRSAGERVYAGEGLVGFAWAFLRGGARRVIAGLWDVDDRSTADLMDAMYGRLAAGDAPPQALRAAKLALIARGGVVAKPYYWGPFQVFTVSVN
jgi:CHAT domain-containing protein/tetratricopeptide (TPR) repeat protein